MGDTPSDSPSVYVRWHERDNCHISEEDLLAMQQWPLKEAIRLTLGRMEQAGVWAVPEPYRKLPIPKPRGMLWRSAAHVGDRNRPNSLLFRLARLAVESGVIPGRYSSTEADYMVDSLSFLQWANDWASRNSYELWPPFRLMLQKGNSKVREGGAANSSRIPTVQPISAASNSSTELHGNRENGLDSLLGIMNAANSILKECDSKGCAFVRTREGKPKHIAVAQEMIGNWKKLAADWGLRPAPYTRVMLQRKLGTLVVDPSDTPQMYRLPHS